MQSQFHSYVVFYMVAQYGSFSKAAEALFISQPAISKSIKALEQLLGVQLFTRMSKGVSLTPEGKLFYEHIHNAMTMLEQGENLLAKLKNLELGQLSIGVSSTLGTHFLLPLLQNFIEQYPHIKLHLINDITFKNIELTKEGKIDLALVSFFTGDDTLDFIPLKEIQDIFVCGPSYYETIKNLSTEELCKQASFMFLSQDSVSRLHIENTFGQLGISITPDIIAGDMTFLIECAKVNLGITTVVKDFVMEDLKSGALIELPLPVYIAPRFIGITYSKTFALSLASQAFIDFMKAQ